MIAYAEYDVAIIGGGLAGLAVSIQLSREGHKVILYEKETYPFHRVCGEYISLESVDFLRELGIDIERLGLPQISKLHLSTVSGKLMKQTLPLGGIGVSRYYLDHELARLAKASGVILHEQAKVKDISFDGNYFAIETDGKTEKVRMASACFGKRSNLDIKWKRPFASAATNKLNNYIGVKYHVRLDYPADTIGLYLFPGGYCGIVKVEGNNYNLCYLTTAANLKNSNNSIPEMERKILSRNPHLKKFFLELEKSKAEPVTISQISFDKKTQVENHIIMVGDAAGMITPLCGNGMSMALHAGKLAALEIGNFLKGKISRQEMEDSYCKNWNQQFASRLRTGRIIQTLFARDWMVSGFIKIGNVFPGLIRGLIRQTHGKAF